MIHQVHNTKAPTSLQSVVTISSSVKCATRSRHTVTHRHTENTAANLHSPDCWVRTSARADWRVCGYGSGTRPWRWSRGLCLFSGAFRRCSSPLLGRRPLQRQPSAPGSSSETSDSSWIGERTTKVKQRTL